MQHHFSRLWHKEVRELIQSETFDQIYRIMEDSFPIIEFRSYEGQKKLLSNPYYRLLTQEDEQGEVIAFLAGWEFESFRFVEHIAVSSVIRGGGRGRQLMEQFMKESSLPVILEVEPPEDELKQRRIGFYERLGFQLGDYNYVQPSLREDQPELPLYIMSYPQRLTETELHSYKEQLYKEVYGVTIDEPTSFS